MGFQVPTGEVDVVDITGRVREVVEGTGVDEGVGHVSVGHTTAAIVLQENESGLVRDVEELLENLAPEGAGYEHDRIDDNAHSHLRAALAGGDVTFPVRGGKPALGTWQSFLLLEFDGPRRRNVRVEVVG